MAEMKQNLHCGLLKQAATLQPRHLPVPETAIQAFHITVNSPLLQSASSKFRLETNSTVEGSLMPTQKSIKVYKNPSIYVFQKYF